MKKRTPNDDNSRADDLSVLENTKTCLLNRISRKSLAVTINVRIPSTAFSTSREITTSWKLTLE